MLQPVAARNACPFLSAGAISGCPGNTAKAAPAEPSTTYRLHRPIKRKDGVTREFFAIWWAEIGRAVATVGEESARNAEFARPQGRGDKRELRGVRPSGWAVGWFLSREKFYTEKWRWLRGPSSPKLFKSPSCFLHDPKRSHLPALCWESAASQHTTLLQCHRQKQFRSRCIFWTKGLASPSSIIKSSEVFLFLNYLKKDSPFPTEQHNAKTTGTAHRLTSEDRRCCCFSKY